MNKMCRTTNQNGRSMIEMLGVLAIIGVLSVGGIAGYSKAMMKFRINKTIDQITQISQNVRMLYGKQRQKNYRNLNTRILYKANLAPKEMFKEGTSYYMMNAWGGPFSIGRANSEDYNIKVLENNNGYFVLSLLNIPAEACIELVTQNWGSSNTTGLNSVVVSGYALGGFTVEEITGNCSGKIGSDLAIACSGGDVLSLPMPVDVAADVCKETIGEYGNLIGWVFQ